MTGGYRCHYTIEDFFLSLRFEKITVKWPNATIIASDTDLYISKVSTANIKEDFKGKIFENFFDFLH